MWQGEKTNFLISIFEYTYSLITFIYQYSIVLIGVIVTPEMVFKFHQSTLYEICGRQRWYNCDFKAYFVHFKDLTFYYPHHFCTKYRIKEEWYICAQVQIWKHNTQYRETVTPRYEISALIWSRLLLFVMIMLSHRMLHGTWLSVLTSHNESGKINPKLYSAD